EGRVPRRVNEYVAHAGDDSPRHEVVGLPEQVPSSHLPRCPGKLRTDPIGCFAQTPGALVGIRVRTIGKSESLWISPIHKVGERAMVEGGDHEVRVASRTL